MAVKRIVSTEFWVDDKVVDSFTPEDNVKESGYKYIYYKVNNYPYQKDTIKAPGFDGYAGVYGVIATKFQAYIDK